MIAGKTNTDRNIEGGSLTTEKPLIRTAKEKGRQLLAVAPPDPEVQDRAVRRRFTAEYKLHILNLADSCTEAGSMGALLRREGLYASNLNTWRHQRDLGVLSGLTPKKRGRKELVRDPLVAENEKLLRENERITKRLRQAEIIVDVQKKVSQLLGIQLAPPARVNGRGPNEMALWAEAGSELVRREKAGEKSDILRVFEDLRARPPESVLTLAEAIAKHEPSIAEGAQFVDLGGADNWIFREDPNVDAAVLDWQPPSTVDVWEFCGNSRSKKP